MTICCKPGKITNHLIVLYCFRMFHIGPTLVLQMGRSADLPHAPNFSPAKRNGQKQKHYLLFHDFAVCKRQSDCFLICHFVRYCAAGPAVALQTERSHDPAHHAISIPANKMENNFKMFHSIRGKYDTNMKNIDQWPVKANKIHWVLKCFEFCKTKHDRKTKQKGQLLEPRNKLCSHWRRRPSFLRCLLLCFCVRCHCFPTWKVPVIQASKLSKPKELFNTMMSQNII